MKALKVMVSVNDENGQFTGCCNLLDVMDENDFIISLEHEGLFVDRSTAIRIAERRVTFGFKAEGLLELEYKTHGKYVGNIFWDCLVIEADQVTKLLNFLRGTGRWHCTGGWTDVYDKWESDEDFTAADLLGEAEAS